MEEIRSILDDVKNVASQKGTSPKESEIYDLRTKLINAIRLMKKSGLAIEEKYTRALTTEIVPPLSDDDKLRMMIELEKISDTLRSKLPARGARRRRTKKNRRKGKRTTRKL